MCCCHVGGVEGWQQAGMIAKEQLKASCEAESELGMVCGFSNAKACPRDNTS